MYRINLKKLLGKKKLASIIEKMITHVNSPISIIDKDDQLLYGPDSYLSLNEYPIEIFGEVVVIGFQEQIAFDAINI